MMELNKLNVNKSMLIEWMNRNTRLDEKEKRTIYNLMASLSEDMEPLYEMNKIVVRQRGQYSNERYGIIFSYNENIVMFSFNDENIQMPAKEFRNIVAACIDIFSQVLPLGTVVDLKKAAFMNTCNVDEIENLRVVISQRFVPYSKDNYIEYVGLHYPFGPFGVENDCLHFTLRAIERIVHMGYTDDVDMAYVCSVKKALVVEQDMHSMAFMSRDEYIKKYNKDFVTQGN